MSTGAPRESQRKLRGRSREISARCQKGSGATRESPREDMRAKESTGGTQESPGEPEKSPRRAQEEPRETAGEGKNPKRAQKEFNTFKKCQQINDFSSNL